MALDRHTELGSAPNPKRDIYKERDEQLKKSAIDAFENHVIRDRTERGYFLAERHKDGGWDQSMCAEIMLGFCNFIYVGGDIDGVVFGHGPFDMRQRIAWIGGTHDVSYYVRQKACIGMGGKGAAASEVWDAAFAEDAVRDRLSQHLDDSDDFEDEIVDWLEDEVFPHSWPSDAEPGELVTLREWLQPTTNAPSGPLYREVLAPLLASTDLASLDNDELKEALRKWAQWLREDHVKKHPLAVAVEEVLEQSPESRDLFIDALYTALPAHHNDFMDDFWDVGMVTAPRVYYCWAAVRKLHHLLLEEEKTAMDDQKKSEPVAR